MASTTEKILYGVKQARVKNLLADGSADGSATEYDIVDPQRVGYAFVYIEGERVDLRGGDDLKAVIQEDDKFLGVDISLDLATLQPEIDATICGGTATPASSKYESPKNDAEEAFPLELTLWVANYEGSDSNSVQDGFVMYTFGFVTGRKDSGEHGDKAFGTQSYMLKARKNISDPSDIKPAYEYEQVASIV
jgi:hypothetical protein